MRQTILSVVIEVQPAAAARLRTLIEALRYEELHLPDDAPSYARLKKAVPLLHFMSMTVFDDDQFDPILVIECNFDGAPGPFWGQLEALYSGALRDMIRCCERPAGPLGDMYDGITAPDARAPIAPYLEAFTVEPAVFHQGNRGLLRDRVAREMALYDAIGEQLNTDRSLRGLDTATLQQRLRTMMAARFPWLNTPEPPRVSSAENIMDWVRLIGFAALVLFVLILPGLVLSLAFPPWLFAVLAAAGSLWGANQLGWMRDPALPAAIGNINPVPIFAGAVAVTLGLCVLSAFSHRIWHGGAGCWVAVLAACIASLLASLIIVLAWIRYLEARDTSNDAPKTDDRQLRALVENEDQITQNHMISIVHVKPGLLRAVLIRAGLRGLGLVLRIAARDGYLASMRTIHFAHWGLVSNGSRLMFHSNFDGTWESYLDDFIEKAHGGLTLAWCNGVGFPPAKFLVLDGATHGKAFKNWARHSMAPSQFWFSAYRDLTVNQIERNVRIADGLRMTALSAAAAAEWARDL